MKIQLVTIRSIMTFLQEIMESNGFTNGSYDVIIKYPTDVTKINIFPTLVVGKSSQKRFPFEIGGASRKQMVITIDVFTNSQNQREDIANILDDNLTEKYISIYNFNSGFPSTVGDYTGITKLGECYVNSLTMYTLPPPVYTEVGQEKFHDIINMIITLPNVTI